jgi:hypothetical protein
MKRIKYSDYKAKLLLEWRWIDLGEVKEIIEKGENVFIVDIESKNHENQKGFLILYKSYPVLVPFSNCKEEGNCIFLITAFWARKYKVKIRILMFLKTLISLMKFKKWKE